MAVQETLAIGIPAPSFSLPGVDGRTYSLKNFEKAPVLVVIFSCNHCPTVQGLEGRMIALGSEFIPQGVGFILINANDSQKYPEDNFDNMKKRSAEKRYPFPYVRDESQDVARAYRAACTPHTFVFDNNRTLRYTGRVDDNWKNQSAVTRQDLREAIQALLKNRPVPTPETLPVGCSIKWR